MAVFFHNPAGPPVKAELCPNHVNNIITPLVMMLDQAAKMGDLSTTITNLVNKSFAAFVTGQKDIDKDWDAYDKSSSNPNNV